MKYPHREFSALELCITALYIYCGFFAACVAAEVLTTDGLAESMTVCFAAAVASGFLVKVWLDQTHTRAHFINLVLVATAFLIGTDTAATFDQ